MPYKTNKQLPPAVQNSLPGNAQSIWRHAFNSMEKEGLSEERSAAGAWSAVKRTYKKNPDGKWVEKNSAVAKCSAETRIIKVDETAGLVYGVAVVCTKNGKPYFDLQGEHVPENVMHDAVCDFMLDHRVNKTMHEGAQTGVVVHSFPLTEEIKKSFGIECDFTGWIVGCKPSDPDIIEMYKKGELTGFSIGGKGLVEDANA